VTIDSGAVTFINRGNIVVNGILGASSGTFIQDPSTAKRAIFASTTLTVTAVGSLDIDNLQNNGILNLQGTMLGNIDNRGQVFIGNATAQGKGSFRQFMIIGDFSQNADTGVLTINIGTYFYRISNQISSGRSQA
jgi:hypothetical protein